MSRYMKSSYDHTAKSYHLLNPMETLPMETECLFKENFVFHCPFIGERCKVGQVSEGFLNVVLVPEEHAEGLYRKYKEPLIIQATYLKLCRHSKRNLVRITDYHFKIWPTMLLVKASLSIWCFFNLTAFHKCRDFGLNSLVSHIFSSSAYYSWAGLTQVIINTQASFHLILTANIFQKKKKKTIAL